MKQNGLRTFCAIILATTTSPRGEARIDGGSSIAQVPAAANLRGKPGQMSRRLLNDAEAAVSGAEGQLVSE
jgi:hypothetical protein